MENIKCSKCKGEMEEGFIKAASAEDLKWGNQGLNFIGGVKNGKSMVTYRCKNCGYLEIYAK